MNNKTFEEVLALGGSADASILAIRKSMECNPATLFSAKGFDGELTPITVHASTQLGVQGQVALDNDKDNLKNTKGKSDADIEKANAERMIKVTRSNPQRVESAFLPAEHDTLVYRFTARANGKKDLPLELCSSAGLAAQLGALFNHYASVGGTEYLGQLFAANIADARFAFRNRAAERIETKVTVRATKTLPDGKDFLFVIDQETPTFVDALNYKNPVIDHDVIEFGSIIGRGLAGNELVMIEVESRLKVGRGQEVYPSQEMVDDSSDNSIKRVYYKDPDTLQAKVHSQKIGNAVRAIDIWHPSVGLYGALPAEPFGNYARRAVAVRLTDNFYSKFLKPEFASLKNKKPSDFSTALYACKNIDDLHNLGSGDVHFFMAILMRGGVLGLESTKK